MCVALDIFFLVPFMMIFVTVLSVATSVGSRKWPISDRRALMDISFWHFSNHPPISASVADAITFLIMLHSTCTGPFSGGISCISVLDLGLKGKYPPALNRVSFLICRIHPNICGESFRFLYILLLLLYVLHCNLIFKWYVLLYLLSALYVPMPVIFVPLKLEGLWL